MKVEVQFVGSSIDVETYEGEYVTWVHGDERVCIYLGTKEKPRLVAMYPDSRIVRIRVIED